MGIHAKMTAIADAIREKTGKPEALNLDAMAAEISGLQTFLPPASDGLSPEEVYRMTRPADWLPLPVPGDDEMYFLGHLTEGEDNPFLIKLRFTGNCTVQFGNLVDGVFTAKETVTPTSDQMLHHMLNYEDYGDETADGYRQYLVRISGSRITDVIGGENSTDTPAFIVDFVCGIPLSFWSANNSDGNTISNKTFVSTRYIRFVGNGTPGDTSCGFAHCGALEALVCQSKSNSQYSSNLFKQCKKIRAISGNILSAKTVGAAYLFGESSIRVVPKTYFRANNARQMFFDSALEAFDGTLIDTSLAENMGDMFNACYCLRTVKDLNISAMTNCSSMFANCRSLGELTFAGKTTPGGITMDLSNTVMGRNALVTMLNSLPTADVPATINIANNPGAAALTDEEIAAASAKNWTVIL